VRAEEGGRGKVGSEIKTSRGRPAGLSYIVSSHGSRLQLPGFFGTEGAHQSQIASASASAIQTDNMNTSHQTETDRCKPVCKRFDMRADARVEASLGQTRYWGAGPVQRFPPTFSSYLGPCLVRKRVWPASWRSKSCKQDSREQGRCL
jgi:hypothetical protein